MEVLIKESKKKKNETWFDFLEKKHKRSRRKKGD